jgi:DNA-binding NarL/FixJ family response regulator
VASRTAGLIILILITLAYVAILSRRVRRLASQQDANRDTAMSKLNSGLEAQAQLVGQMSMDVEDLRKRLLGQEEVRPSQAPMWASAGAPVNLNSRGQILRLSRKGKSVAEIAQDLNVAQGEVELLLKVHDLSQQSDEEK